MRRRRRTCCCAGFGVRSGSDRLTGARPSRATTFDVVDRRDVARRARRDRGRQLRRTASTSRRKAGGSEGARARRGCAGCSDDRCESARRLQSPLPSRVSPSARDRRPRSAGEAHARSWPLRSRRALATRRSGVSCPRSPAAAKRSIKGCTWSILPDGFSAISPASRARRRRISGTLPVEDNAFFLLRTGPGQVASLHASWTEWKNCSRSRSSAAPESSRSRTGRKLRSRAARAVRDDAGARTAADDDLGVPDGGRLLGSRIRRVSRRHRGSAAYRIPGCADAAAALAIVERVYAAERGA